MSQLTELLQIRAQLVSAKQRFQQLHNEEDKLVVAIAPCSLCQLAGGGRGDVGVPCRKNWFGPYTYSHAERRRAATALIAARGSKKMKK